MGTEEGRKQQQDAQFKMSQFKNVPCRVNEYHSNTGKKQRV